MQFAAVRRKDTDRFSTQGDTTMTMQNTETRRQPLRLRADMQRALIELDALQEAASDAFRERCKAELAAATCHGTLWKRIQKVDPEAARLLAEIDAAEARGDEAAARIVGRAFDARFVKFRDADKRFTEAKRKVKAAKRTEAAALRALRAATGEDEDEDGEE
jgi:hypothetical protein